MPDDHAAAAARLQRRMLAFSGHPVSAPPRHHYPSPLGPEREHGIDDHCVLLALRANERISNAGYGAIEAGTGEGLVEHRRRLEMDARHYQLVSVMLRKRGAEVGHYELQSAMCDTAAQLRQTPDLRGTTLETRLMVTETGDATTPSTRATLQEDPPWLYPS